MTQAGCVISATGAGKELDLIQVLTAIMWNDCEADIPFKPSHARTCLRS